jgi:uncharacterized protein with PIN domain
MPLYSLDTSSLVAAWLERYPIENFEGFWSRMDELMSSGNAVLSREVLREVKRRDDGLHSWLRKRESAIIEIDDACQEHVADIMSRYPKFVDTSKGKNIGDPFVIALARTYSPNLRIISEENGGSENRPKIPFVCTQEKLNCSKIVDLIRAEKWQFKG